ncbi:MAG TPA: translation initiation factor IF-2 [Candidatus Obscuribacterales bacterium]
MNNGKVRIYDLSKELDLDNKDILVICDQLNIAVKSHSSTISESEAERIRAAAEKYSPQATAPRRSALAERTERRGSPSAQPNGRPNLEHKQQILQIKHKSGSGSSSNQSGANMAIPPQPPVKQPIASPMKPTTLNKPVRQQQQDAALSSPDGELKLPQKPVAPAPVASAPVASAPVAPAPVAPAPAPVAFMEQRPQLSEPPLRSKSVEMADVDSANKVDRPVLKRAKVEPPAKGAIKTPTNAKPVGEKRATPKQEAPEQEPQPIPELQRPQRKVRSTVAPVVPPQRPDIAARGGEVIPMPKRLALGTEMKENADSSIETLDLQLQRPTPPRLVKRTKNWENEEEEDSEASAKAGKLGTKGKRRTPIIIDEDDEDLAAELDGLQAPVMVSLSVARPPKQKTPPGLPITAERASAIGSGHRAKKPGAKRDSDGQKSDNRDRRRDQKAVSERPEKIVLTGSMTVRELATALEVPETEIIRKLFFKGMAVNITQTLDVPTASMVAEDLGVEVETGQEQAPATKVTEMLNAEDMENLQRRPPVVTIMGHVDHGKTTLLDAIRQTKVAQGEAGGITQHIGAYHVDVEHEGQMQQVVFLDTPGHEAFTAMRARGARVTDIAVLVVAADDGVRPQTIEAIKHAQAAEVPIVVAINKTDKPEAQPDRVKQELTEYAMVPEEWGGSTIMVPVSALKGENLDTLLEMILLVAEIEELSANPNRPAKGTVIEAHLDKAKGPVATLLVQNGTLRVGDTLVAGHVLGKVRAMVDDQGARVEAASPSFAVEVLGLSDVPAAGDDFDVFQNEKEARATAQDRSDEQRQSRLQQVMSSRRVTLNSLSAQAQEGDLKELNLILKADVQGSVEAILGALRQLPQNEVQVRVLFAAAGEVTETDVDLAAASGAVIVGFNTTLASGARSAADQAGVDVREYNIIYKLLDDIQGAMEGLLEPEQVEEPLGQVEVRAVFPVGRGAVAGCYVLSGKAIRNCQLRVHRGGKMIYQGVLDSLKRMKDDVKEVNAGFECGVRVDKFNDWAEGDIIETFQMVSKRRTLSTT